MKSVEYLIDVAKRSGFFFTKEEIEKAHELFAEETNMFSKGDIISCGNLEAIAEYNSIIVTDVTYIHNYHQDTISNEGWKVVKLKKIVE